MPRTVIYMHEGQITHIYSEASDEFLVVSYSETGNDSALVGPDECDDFEKMWHLAYKDYLAIQKEPRNLGGRRRG